MNVICNGKLLFSMSHDQLLSFHQTVTRTEMYSCHCCLDLASSCVTIKFVIITGNVFNLFSITIRDKGFFSVVPSFFKLQEKG